MESDETNYPDLNHADVPVHDWQLEEVKRRAAYLKQHPESALTWEEIKRRVRQTRGSEQ